MKEEQLIFLISQPRSGSTLTQKLLGAHSKIYTRSEPWLMMHPLYSLKNSGIYAEYNFETEREAFDGFLTGLPEGRQTYVNEINKMYLKLYSYYLKDSSCNYFLDKTPRYYLVADELQLTFPKAKYILLIRNPLAVLGSIIKTWTKTNWHYLSRVKYDLTTAIEKYIDIIDNKKDNYFMLRYEDLLADNEVVLKGVFNYLDLIYEEEIHNYNDKNEKWGLGDQGNVYEKKGVDASNDKKWQQFLNDPQYWRVMHDYLDYIGEERFYKLGYDYDEAIQTLYDAMPASTIEDILSKTFSLFSFLDDTRECLIENNRNKQVIARKKNELANKQNIINEKDKSLYEKQNIIVQKNKDLLDKDRLISEIFKSKKYRLGSALVYPFLRIKNIF